MPDCEKRDPLATDRQVLNTGDPNRTFRFADKRDAPLQCDEIQNVGSSDPLNLDMGVSVDLLDTADDVVLDLPAWPRIAYDEVLIGKLIPGQVSLFCKTVILGHCSEDAFGPELCGVAVGPFRVTDYEGNVQLHLADSLRMVGRFAFEEINVNASVFFIVPAE